MYLCSCPALTRISKFAKRLYRLDSNAKMEVFTFEKSFLERLKEAEAVLLWEGAVIPASQVRSEWKSYVELKIEPAGKCMCLGQT